MESKNQSRIRKSSEYSLIKRSGRNLPVSSWLLLNYKKNSLGYLRFGVTVSKKVGGAVTRNKWKRWCRTYVYDLLKSGYIAAVDVNFVFRPSASSLAEGFSYCDFKAILDSGFGIIKSNVEKMY